MAKSKSNKKLEDIASKIKAKLTYNHDDDYGAIITILIIISLVLTLIRIIQECNKDKIRRFNIIEKTMYFGTQIKDKSFRRSWFTKRIVKKAIKKELNDEAYNKYGVALMNAILDTGEVLTDDEVKTLVEATNV